MSAWLVLVTVASSALMTASFSPLAAFATRGSVLKGAAATCSSGSSGALKMVLAGKERRPENAPGNLYVDESCIDCSTCRWMAPSTYARVGYASAVVDQPQFDSEKIAAYEAMIACPTGSIRTEQPDKLVKQATAAFPLPIDDVRLPGVYHLGYHSKASYGATPYLIVRGEGAAGGVMVDSPRYSSVLAKAIRSALGGNEPQYMVLSHQDDVADHAKWATVFPNMQRIMHTGDMGRGFTVQRGELEVELSDENATGRLPQVPDSREPGRLVWSLAPDLKIIHTPGHTSGSVTLWYGGGEGAAFTGDHVAFSWPLQRLDGFLRYNRKGVKLQARSILALGCHDSSSSSSSSSVSSTSSSSSSSSSSTHVNGHHTQELQTEVLPFLWVLPGHGRRASYRTHADRRAAFEEGAVQFAEAGGVKALA